MPRKTSNNCSFLRKYWIEIITIIIAICGGFPGIISIVNYFRDKPILGFQTFGYITGVLSQDDSDQAILFVLGAVTNKGTKPLNPVRFYFKIKVNDEWVSLYPDYIPEANYIFSSGKEKIEMQEDLAKINLEEWREPVLIGQPARGCLMFRIDKDVYEYLKDKNSFTYQLTCLDIYNDKYTFTSTAGPFDNNPRAPRKKFLKYNIISGPNE